MGKVSVAIGEEFPLQETDGQRQAGCRHHGRHHHRHHHHGGALFILPVLAAGITAGIYYPLWTLLGAGALVLAAVVSHGIWHFFRRNTPRQDGV